MVKTFYEYVDISNRKGEMVEGGIRRMTTETTGGKRFLPFSIF